MLEVKPQASSKANMNWVLPAPCTFLSVFFPSLHLKLDGTKLDPAPYKNRKRHAVHVLPWALHWGDCTVPLPFWHLHSPLYVVSASDALSAAKTKFLRLLTQFVCKMYVANTVDAIGCWKISRSLVKTLFRLLNVSMMSLLQVVVYLRIVTLETPLYFLTPSS